MRVKSRKPPAEYLITSERVTSSMSRRGADDRIGDQVRQMAGDREHAVVMVGRHRLDLGAQPPPEFGDALDRGVGRVVGRGEDAPAAVEQRGEAGFGPAALGAGDRVRGDDRRRRAARRCSAASTLPLDDPTSLTIASAGRSAAIASAAAPIAPTGTQRMTRSASVTAAPGVSATSSQKPERASPRRAPRDRRRGR